MLEIHTGFYVFMFSELNNAQITIDILGHSFMWCFIIRNLDSRNIPGATFQMAPEVSRRNILQQENVDYLGEGISWCWKNTYFDEKDQRTLLLCEEVSTN